MSVSIRSLLVPAVAVAAAGTVALSPVLVAASGQSVLPAVPSIVHVDDVQLAGIGQDIYYAITPTVQYVVGGGSYLINFIPLIGGVIAAQININYFQGIQPVVEATVNYLAGVVQDPLNFGPTTAIYASTLYDIAYNWVSAELQWVGLSPLPLLPPLPTASVGESAPQPAGARTAAAVEQTSARADLRRTARSAAAVRATTAVDTTADTGAQESAVAPAAEDSPSAAVDTASEVRTPARATRGQAARAAQGAASEVRGAAGPTRG